MSSELQQYLTDRELGVLRIHLANTLSSMTADDLKHFEQILLDSLHDVRELMG